MKLEQEYLNTKINKISTADTVNMTEILLQDHPRNPFC
jgi:hypothetical protein